MIKNGVKIMSDSPSQKRRKLSFKERRSKLEDELSQMKKKLAEIEEKRKIELGSLMLKYELGDYEDSVLEPELKSISNKLKKNQ